MLARRRARTDLIGFTEYTFAKYRCARPHRIIAAQLERVERGECDRLMLLLPPRHGKSELASRRFPAYYLGRHPDRGFIASSATADLATDFGRDVRNIVASPEYGALFQTRLAEDSQARGKWHTTEGGVFYAVGVAGNIMGRGGDVFLIDDPFANMADAQSELARKRVWDWYTGTVYNRLAPGGSIIVINHRMHEDDLSGRLLAQQAAGGDRWEVVELPAIDEAGEALWPEAYPIEALERIRENTLPRYWSALYQQNPIPDEGTYFKREWFRLFDAVPTPEWAETKGIRLYGASDYAVSEGRGDWTVHFVAGVDAEDNLYVLDRWREQKQSDAWVEALCDMIQRWKPLKWAEPRDQINNSLGPFIVKRMRERRAYCNREQFPDVKDKPTKARAFQGRAAMGKVWLPKSAPWLTELLAELVAFDAGKNDDQVDALGLFGRMLDTMVGKSPKGPSKPEVDRWDRAFGRHDRGEAGWKVA